MRIAPFVGLFIAYALGAVACSSSDPIAAPATQAGNEASKGDKDRNVDDSDDDVTEPDAATSRDAGKKSDAAPTKDAAQADADDVGDDAATASGPTFTDVYTTVISGTCTGCHGNTHGTGLAMKTQALAYANLVGKKAGTGGAGACNNGQRTRVVAGDASGSLLFAKISHAQDCGSGMPLNGAKLSQAKIDLVEAWINAGAKND